MQPVQSNCPSCGNVFVDTFCSRCGEKRISPHDFAIKYFVEEGIEGFTHFDNKFLRTMKLLLFRPGQLTKSYFEGKRVPYMKPFQLFIVCNILFFLFLGGGNPFSIRFNNFNGTPYSYFHTDKLIKSRANTTDKLAAYTTQFNEKVSRQSKTFIIVIIPFLALGLALIYLRKRRYFTEHLAFATHFFSFVLVYFLLVAYLVVLPVMYIGKVEFNSTGDYLLSTFSIVILVIYFAVAGRRFYNISKWYTTLSTIFFLFLFAAAVLAYRLFLFYKIFYSIHL